MKTLETRIVEYLHPTEQSMLEYDKAKMVIVCHNHAFSSQLLDFGIGLEHKSFLTLPRLYEEDYYESEIRALESYYEMVESKIKEWIEKEHINEWTQIKKDLQILPIYLD